MTFNPLEIFSIRRSDADRFDDNQLVEAGHSTPNRSPVRSDKSQLGLSKFYPIRAGCTNQAYRVESSQKNKLYMDFKLNCVLKPNRDLESSSNRLCFYFSCPDRTSTPSSIRHLLFPIRRSPSSSSDSRYCPRMANTSGIGQTDMAFISSRPLQ